MPEEEDDEEEKDDKASPSKGMTRGHHKNDIPAGSEEFEKYVYDSKIVPTEKYLDTTTEAKVLMKINNVDPNSSNTEFREFLSQNGINLSGVITARPRDAPTNVNFFLKVENRETIISVIKLEGVKFENRRLIV